jgi:hypothetical protein
MLDGETAMTTAQAVIILAIVVFVMLVIKAHSEDGW